MSSIVVFLRSFLLNYSFNDHCSNKSKLRYFIEFDILKASENLFALFIVTWNYFSTKQRLLAISFTISEISNKLRNYGFIINEKSMSLAASYDSKEDINKLNEKNKLIKSALICSRCIHFCQKNWGSTGDSFGGQWRCDYM